MACFGLSFGGIGGQLVRKLVKQTKVLCSWPPDEAGFDQLWLIQTKADIRTRAARVLRETDTAMWQELGRLDLADGLMDQGIELLPLLVGDRSSQILNLDQTLTHKNDLGDVGDSRYPGIAEQLGVESQ